MRIDSPVFNIDSRLFSPFRNKKMKIDFSVLNIVIALSSSLNKMRYGLKAQCLRLSNHCSYLSAIKRGDCDIHV